ncbi:MAG: hypothetical protein AAB821_02515 [Patescibacteria group bacterium]
MKRNFETPRVPEASKSENPIFREVHAAGETPTVVSETTIEAIEETRESITQKYDILPQHVLADIPYEGKRKILAFSILIHRLDPTKRYYNEGHVPHALLFDTILKKYESEVGHDIWELDLEQWITKKGFLDPQHNGFKSFPETRQALVHTWESNQDINGDIPKDPNGEIPNWFLSGDSEHKKG